MIYTVITSKSAEVYRKFQIKILVCAITLRVYDLHSHYIQECRRCHQEMEEIQSKAIQKILKRYIMNSWITQEQVSVILRLW